MGLAAWGMNTAYNLGARFFCWKFLQDTKRAGEVNRKVLQDILALNAETVYGRCHNFAGIRDAAEFKQKVPLTDYTDYELLIERIKLGEEKVLTAEPVSYFGLSSGTTGKQKFIPTTDRSRRIINLNMMFLQHGMLGKILPEAHKGDKGCLLMNMVEAGNSSTSIPTGAGTSSGVKSMQKMFPYFWTSPLEVLQISNQKAANYLHLLFALREQDLAYIGAPFPSAIVQMFGVLEESWTQLVKDLAHGTIDDDLPIEVELKEALSQKLTPDPKRAAQLQLEFGQGIEGIAKRVWPKMVYISCVTGGSFNIYMDKLRYYTRGLPVYAAIYGATEALIAVADKLDAATYAVTPRPAYYEFIPLDQSEKSSPHAYDLDQLKIGESYEIVITNYSGFYRYRLGDVVKVVGQFNRTPVIEFLYRKGQLLNLDGEKTPESAVQHALQAALNTFGFSVEDYTVEQDLHGSVGRYRFFIEINNLDTGRLPEQLRKELEKTLGEANPRYRAGLQAGRIAPLELCPVRPGTFQALRRVMLQKGASQNQVKIPRVVKDGTLLTLLQKNILC